MNEFNNPPDDEQNQDENPELSEKNQLNPEPGKSPKLIVSPVTAAFIGLIGGFFLYQVFGGLLTVLILGVNLEKAPVQALRLMTMAGQVLFILLPALIFSKIFFVDVGKMVRAKLPNIVEVALFLFGMLILTPLLQSFMYIQTHFIEQGALKFAAVKEVKTFFDSMNDLVEKTYGNLLSANNVFEGIFVILVIALVPAICEETMFRGFIQKSFEHKIKPIWAALITAIFFGVYHFNPYGVIPLIALGFYFGFAAYMSNSIVVPIILHFFNNFTAVITYFIIGKEDLIEPSAKNSFDLNLSLSLFAVLLLVFGGIIFLINKYYSKNSGNSGINSVNE